MTTKPEWERLAEALEGAATGCQCRAHFYDECSCDDAVWPEVSIRSAATELRRLGQENEGYRTLVNNAVSGLKNEEARIAAVTHLVRQLHQAKGRYHTQMALCALFDAFGLSNTKPEKTK